MPSKGCSVHIPIVIIDFRSGVLNRTLLNRTPDLKNNDNGHAHNIP